MRERGLVTVRMIRRTHHPRKQQAQFQTCEYAQADRPLAAPAGAIQTSRVSARLVPRGMIWERSPGFAAETVFVACLPRRSSAVNPCRG